MKQRLKTHYLNWKGMRLLTPLFFLFLILGVSVLLPYLIMYPAFVTLSSAWKRTPQVLWRSAIITAAFIAFMITQPTSPWFYRLDIPISRDLLSGSVPAILEEQIVFINAALIALVIVFPISAANALCAMIDRRQSDRVTE